MPWKQSLDAFRDDTFITKTEDGDELFLAIRRKELEDGITEIIKKIIDDIPDELAGQYGTINSFPKLKQQLRYKWL